MSLNLSLVLMPLTRTLSYGGGADRCGISNFISTARDTLLHVVRSPPGEQEIYSRKWYTSNCGKLYWNRPRVVCILVAASYCSFTDIPHRCGQTRCWRRGVNRADQPENEIERLFPRRQYSQLFDSSDQLQLPRRLVWEVFNHCGQQASAQCGG